MAMIQMDTVCVSPKCWKFGFLCDSADTGFDLEELKPWGDYT